MAQRNSFCRAGFYRHMVGVSLLVTMSLLLGGCGEKQPAAAPGPPDVQVTDVVQQDVPIYSEWVAQLNGDTNAEIVPKVQGYLLRRTYQEGSLVRQGRTPFRDRSTAISSGSRPGESANRATAQAVLSKADTDVARDAPLASPKCDSAEAT